VCRLFCKPVSLARGWQTLGLQGAKFVQKTRKVATTEVSQIRISGPAGARRNAEEERRTHEAEARLTVAWFGLESSIWFLLRKM
jgi:hypothetical protein